MSDTYVNQLGKRLGRRALIAIAVPATFLLMGGALYLMRGSRGEELPAVYGKRSGAEATASVNGTRVLAEMFIKNGHKLRTINRLSPSLNDKADVIVWIPDSFEPPTKEQRNFLEAWLAKGRGRTLIYVGRDYDAAGEYYRAIAPQLGAQDQAKFKRHEAEAKADYDSRRFAMPKEEYARWFTARRDGQKHVARSLQGPWAAGINSAKAAIQIEGRLDPPQEKDRKDKTGAPPLPEQVTPLLWSDLNKDGVYQPKEAAIVTRITDKASFGTSGQIIVVTNSSFVLNYPLINHEHRKLAGKLIEECAPGAKVAFIESRDGEPKVLDKEPTAERSEFPWILVLLIIQFAALGIIYCLAHAAIFGRPKELPGEAAADFGKHVTALGQLMARSHDRVYAEQRISQYQQQGKRKSGKSHLKGP